MSEPFVIGDRTLLPIKMATEIVPYTRDYISRLAREGKIAAAQVNRQWYIDGESLKNFFETAQLEVQARNSYVRELRRVELESADALLAALTASDEKFTIAPYRSLVATVYVLSVGCLVGLLIWQGVGVFTPSMLQSQYAALMQAPVLNTTDTDTVDTAWMEYGAVIDTTESLQIDNGILLLPTATSGEAVVEALFSDPVTVEMQSTTSGQIILTTPTGTTTVPYVRVPNSATVSTTTMEIE